MGAVNQGGAPNVAVVSQVVAVPSTSAAGISTSPTQHAPYMSGITGALPATFTLAGRSVYPPIVFLRRG